MKISVKTHNQNLASFSITQTLHITYKPLALTHTLLVHTPVLQKWYIHDSPDVPCNYHYGFVSSL